MLLSDKLNEEGLEIYFKYEYLDVETVFRLFRHINQIHEAILRTTSPVYFNQDTQERFRNIFDVIELHTGQSIKAKFKEKWKVELPFNLGKVEGPFPKKLGVPMIVLFFMLLAVERGYSIYNSRLDTTIKELDIELKRNELFRQMEERRKTDPTFNASFRQARQLVDYIRDNPDIKYFEINKVPIKIEDSRP